MRGLQGSGGMQTLPAALLRKATRSSQVHPVEVKQRDGVPTDCEHAARSRCPGTVSTSLLDAAEAPHTLRNLVSVAAELQNGT